MLAKGNDKTRLRLKQLSLLLFRFALLYLTKHFQWPLKGISFGQQTVKLKQTVLYMVFQKTGDKFFYRMCGKLMILKMSGEI